MNKLGKILNSNWLWIGMAVLALLYLSFGTPSAQASESAAVASQVPTLSVALAQVIQTTQEGLQAGVDFLKAEIPDVIRQLLIFKTVELAVYVSLGILCLLTVAVYWYAFITAPDRDKDGKGHDNWWWDGVADRSEASCVIGAFGTLILGIAGLCAIFANMAELLMVYLAPKVWLVQYAASLVK